MLPFEDSAEGRLRSSTDCAILQCGASERGGYCRRSIPLSSRKMAAPLRHPLLAVVNG